MDLIEDQKYQGCQDLIEVSDWRVREMFARIQTATNNLNIELFSR